MNEVFFKGNNKDYLKFSTDEDFFKYGASVLEIQVGNYFVRSVIHLSYGDLKRLGESLGIFYSEMKGTNYFTDIEESLEINFSFNKRGYVILNGRYKERDSSINELKYELECTQPELFETINYINSIRL